jgi:predicted DNA-binding antitoxin AbrB/MazE fold protein
MKSIEAVYEHGVLRPLEPLSLPEGARVQVSVTGKAPTKKVSQSGKTPAQILAEIAALSEHHGVAETASVDHDEILYGWKRGK